MGWTDIVLRYRRTIIGPFWMTISTGIMITAMGVVWGIIFNTDLSTFFPYLASGLVTWFLISTIVTESTNSISDRPGNLKDFNLPVSFTAFRLVTRNFIVFAHNVLIYFVVAIIFEVDFFTPALAGTFIGLFLVFCNGTWIAIILSIVGARYRDVQQLIASVITIFFFITPIIWQRQALGNNQFIATFNPLTHLIDIVRAPLLGLMPPFSSYMIVLVLTALGWTITVCLLARTRHRIVFWL